MAPDGQKCRARARNEAIEHEDACLRREAPRLGGLGRCGDEEGVAPGADECRNDAGGAGSISVGFDHGSALCGGDEPRECAPVAGDSSEIDGDDACGG